MKGSIQKRIAILLLVTVLTLFACSCDRIEEPTEPEKVAVVDEDPSPGGTMVIGSVEPKGLNPLTTDSKSFLEISKLMFEQLVDYDSSFKLKLVLAKSIDFAGGASECIVTLKDGLLWSDGNPISTNDIKYSIDAIKSAKASNYKSNIEHIYSYRVLDKNRISIVFDQAFANTMDMLSFPIIPEHVFSRNAEAIPACSGAYKIDQYSRLKSMELVQNENWVGLTAEVNGDNARPFIERIKVRFINEVEAFSTAFQSRELDMLNTLSYDWGKYSELKDVSAYKYISMYYDFIGLNHNNPLFKDKAIRRAILLSINRKALVDKYLLGNAVIVDTPINPNSWLYDEVSNRSSFSQLEAQNILAAAGFRDADGDKVLERNIDGGTQSLRFTLITNSDNDFRKKAAEDIKKNLEEVGFKIELKLMNFEEMKLAMEATQYDAVLTGYNLSPTHDLSFAFHSSQIGAGKNYYSYSNPSMDDMLYQAYTSMNENTRKEIFKNIQIAFKEEVPSISLFFREGAVVSRNKILGEIKPDAVNPYRNINRWFVSESAR